MKLGFLGAAREVTGSCFLAEATGVRFLVDCGMVQGGRAAAARNRETFAFDPASIDFVLLTHAHIDHSGLLPKLTRAGIMEAANRGAFEVGARSIGLNITLPHEQAPNPYMCPELAFRFHYFALRKMHFLMHARGLVSFPGGYGMLDELFEVLTLIQTGKMPRIPVVLVGREFWQRAVDFDFLRDEGYVSPGDLELFTSVDKAEEIISAFERFYVDGPPEGRPA